MLGVGGLSLSLGRAGEGGGGSRGGGHLSRRMLLLERPFLPRFLHRDNMGDVFSESSERDAPKNQPWRTHESTRSKKNPKKNPRHFSKEARSTTKQMNLFC